MFKRRPGYLMNFGQFVITMDQTPKITMTNNKCPDGYRQQCIGGVPCQDGYWRQCYYDFPCICIK